jgi:hypothetical protein
MLPGESSILFSSGWRAVTFWFDCPCSVGVKSVSRVVDEGSVRSIIVESGWLNSMKLSTDEEG